MDDNQSLPHQDEQIKKPEQEYLELKLTELNQREQDLSSKEEALQKKNVELFAREQRIEILELEAKNGFPNLLNEQFKSVKNGLDTRESDLTQQWQDLEQSREQLRQQKEEITKAEIVRDNGFSEQRQAFDDDLERQRKEFNDKQAEVKNKRLADLENEIKTERSQRLAALQTEIQEAREHCSQELNQWRAEFNEDKNAKEKELRDEAERLAKLQGELDDDADNITFEKSRLESRSNALDERESNLNEEIDSKLAERKKSFESTEVRLNQECDRLRASIQETEKTLSIFDELKRKLGDEDPAIVLDKLKILHEANNKLRQNLQERPPAEMQRMFDESKAEIQSLNDACKRLSEEKIIFNTMANDYGQLEIDNQKLIREKNSLTNQFQSIEADNNRLTADLKRLQSSYEREQDRDTRIKDIELPYFAVEKIPQRSKGKVNELQKLNINEERDFTEIEWLDNISKACADYGFTFPERILYAFHTALKTAEWSPLTILSGVSGTGKSELPRLYSHFGGINFLPLAVQSNWDSQESMLGFFNSIDNKFDAQPVLRFLTQSQKEKNNEYPEGLKDTVNLILLDEMNLAHIELYFAEFLSKLELRRGKGKNELPPLDIKLGSGVEPYKLPLGRNVLWAGTMNQDETTKSLSDKVLDRGMVIHFPRPTELHSRKELKPLLDTSHLLLEKTWNNWWSKKSNFTPEQIEPFKKFVEEINGYLETVGMALGHRVWQSIEYYMANYPTIKVLETKSEAGHIVFKDELALKKEMKIAFEDQLVQKIMPKLRGIETTSECIVKIREQLERGGYAIVEDFKLACKFGYGQFMWNSAKYLNDEHEANNASDDSINESEEINTEINNSADDNTHE
ncbi:MAG: chromosome partitioning protein ParA [Methylococcaceae bacterium]|nr:MAG: chromosome partitioning protein ParA [Methylococcaceae bacterium]